MVDHMQALRGLARTLTALMATGSGALIESSRALKQAVTDLVAAAVKDGAVREDVGAGAVMAALHGFGGPMSAPDGVPRPTVSSLWCWTGCADRVEGSPATSIGAGVKAVRLDDGSGGCASASPYELTIGLRAPSLTIDYLRLSVEDFAVLLVRMA